MPAVGVTVVDRLRVAERISAVNTPFPTIRDGRVGAGVSGDIAMTVDHRHLTAVFALERVFGQELIDRLPGRKALPGASEESPILACWDRS